MESGSKKKNDEKTVLYFIWSILAQVPENF